MNNDIKDIREIALEQIAPRRVARFAHPDSLTGFTQSVGSMSETSESECESLSDGTSDSDNGKRKIYHSLA